MCPDPQCRLVFSTYQRRAFSPKNSDMGYGFLGSPLLYFHSNCDFGSGMRWNDATWCRTGKKDWRSLPILLGRETSRTISPHSCVPGAFPPAKLLTLAKVFACRTRVQNAPWLCRQLLLKKSCLWYHKAALFV